VTVQPTRLNLRARDFWLVLAALALYWLAFVVLSMMTASAIPVA
jgi:hypothetical protein